MIVIFSGYNQRAVIAFIRTLQKNNVDYSIIALGDNDPIWFSEYRYKIVYTRKNKSLGIDEIINVLSQIRVDDEDVMIAPSTEYLNRFLLEHRDELKEIGYYLPLTDKETYFRISEKRLFVDLCREFGINTPKEYSGIVKYSAPLVAKPNYYFASDGKIYNPIFIKSEVEYNDFVSKHNVNDFSFQEYIEGGESFYILFYFNKDSNVFLYSQKNIAQQAGGKSIIAAESAEYHKEKELVQPYINMFKSLDFRGMVMVEVRRFNGIDYMIEANPRFWGPSNLFVDSDYNFFEYLLEDYGIIKASTRKLSDKKHYYFWSSEIAGDISEDTTVYWHEGMKEYFFANRRDFEMADIYKKEDTIDIYKLEKLKSMYEASSKHSNYQILASPLRRIINQDELRIKSRQETERFNYIDSKLDISGKHIIDIGGNTGYFTLECVDKYNCNVDYYEGNIKHAEFVRLSSEILNVEDKITVHPEYFSFSNNINKADIILNLNVIHHLGDDFGKNLTSGEYCQSEIEKARRFMAQCVNYLYDKTKYMVLQMGFNWMGDRKKCLFKNGTKSEMIQFIKDLCKDYWEIINIGVAVLDEEGAVRYEDLNEINIERNDKLGEFLNRPIFIMKSKNV